MTFGSPWLTVGVGLASFLAAAKAHGRQVRLERERAGFWEVAFGARNPPFVEALWRQERRLFWSSSALLALATGAGRILAQRLGKPVPFDEPGHGLLGLGLFHGLLPLIAAFVVTGLLSLGRLGWLLRREREHPERPRGWLRGAVWGSAAWWALCRMLVATLLAHA